MRADISRPTIRLAHHDEYLPYSYRVNGRMTGEIVKRTNHVFDTVKMNATHQGFPWLRAQKYVRIGAMDSLCTNPTLKRREYLHFSALPVLQNPRGIVCRKDQIAAAEITSLKDLNKHRIGDYIGNGWAAENLGSLDISWVAGQHQILRMISLGRLDATIGSEQNMKAFLKALHLEDELAFKPLAFLEPYAFHIGLRKSYPDALSIMDKIDRSLETLTL